MEKGRAAWDLDMPRWWTAWTTFFGVGFHPSMIACGSSVLIRAVRGANASDGKTVGLLVRLFGRFLSGIPGF